MASIGIAYFVTLCLYPGIVSEIISCKFESWMPVILMAAFNAADLLGKVLGLNRTSLNFIKQHLIQNYSKNRTLTR